MKKIAWILLCTLGVTSCSSPNENKADKEDATQNRLASIQATTVSRTVIDTIKSLDAMKDSVAYFKDSEGNIYLLKQISDGEALKTAGLSCDTDAFLGTGRRAAKWSKLSVTYQTYANAKLMMSTLPTDSFMRNYTPPISSATTSARVAEEKRNVTITTAWLYALKREDDNDFHLIIGSDTTPQQSELFNVEVSGLPPSTSTSYSTLKMVRDTIIKRFGQVCKTSYTSFTPPMKILVKGSLFYDIDHAAGTVGPTGYRPQTSWEIHPVTKIQFK